MTFYNASKACQIPDIDRIYKSIFGKTTEGSFCEVGGYDGESFSNTSCLAEWKPKVLIVELEDGHDSFKGYDHITAPCRQLREDINISQERS